MVSLLVCNKDTTKAKQLCGELTNDKKFRIEIVNNENDALAMYLHINPNILVLDNSITDVSIKEILDRLSSCPHESKKCNTIITKPINHSINLKNVSKVHTIIDKPITNNELVNTIKIMANDFNTPDLTDEDVDWFLQILDFNSVSPGYKLMRDAIKYCYYRPHEIKLINVLHHLAYKYKIPETRARDQLKASIRPFNNKNHDMPDELYAVLHNNGYELSLKDFLEKNAHYLLKIKKEGRKF